MKIHLLIFLSITLLFNKIHAAPINLDIYGVEQKIQNEIMSCCKRNIYEYIQIQQNLIKQGNADLDLKKYQTLEKSILKKINALGNFSHTKISMVYYPEDKTTYTTIDIVKKSDSYRLPVSSERLIKKNYDKNEGLINLFKLWDGYIKRNLALIRSNNLDFKSKSCPVVHCIWGFDKKEMQYEVPKLKKGASKYKIQLMDILEHSANSTDREQSIFILAHLDNHQELAHFLMKFTNDPDDSVRNNVMRVLGAILAQHNVTGLDIDQIIKALNYPYVTDRNKAGYVLLNLATKDKSAHSLIVKRAGTTLINLLKLKQPNNHDFAYRILKVISNKNYSDRDYKSWQTWVDSAFIIY